MNAKKALKIICIAGAGLCVIVFAYLWSLGVFSGSSVYSERNPVVEEVVEKVLNEKIATIFEKEDIFTDKDVKFESVDAQVAMYSAQFPLDKYKTAADVKDADIKKALNECQNGITIEVKLVGKRIDFNPYKVIAYQCMHAIYEDMKLEPYNMQLFYYRLPEGEEKENVLAYESRIPGYLFHDIQKNVVNQTKVHYIVELDESLETKAKWYYGYQIFYFAFLGITVIALTTFLIVRVVKKRNRYKNS